MHKYYIHVPYHINTCDLLIVKRTPSDFLVVSVLGVPGEKAKRFLDPINLLKVFPTTGQNISIVKPLRNLFHPHLLMGIIHRTTGDFIHHATRAGIGHAMLVV